jgi:hypothetical protein
MRDLLDLETQDVWAVKAAFSLSGALTLAALTFLLILLGVMPTPMFDLIQTMIH